MIRSSRTAAPPWLDATGRPTPAFLRAPQGRGRWRKYRFVPTVLALSIAAILYETVDLGGEHEHGPSESPAVAAPPAFIEPVDQSRIMTPPPAEEPFVHVVEPGDLLGTIASKYNVTPESILRANPQLDPNVLQVGQHLRVPGATTTALVRSGGDAEPGATADADGTVVHVVASGELLVALAELYGVPVDHIVAFNELMGDDIAAGQELLIPPPWMVVDH